MNHTVVGGEIMIPVIPNCLSSSLSHQVRNGLCEEEHMGKKTALLSNYHSLRILVELSHPPALSEFPFWDKLTKAKVERTETSGQKSGDKQGLLKKT